MREFKALKPTGLPKGFDVDVHTEEPVVQVTESPGRIVLNYSFPGFYLVDDPHVVDGRQLELRQIQITSTGRHAESGKPLLPSFGRYVQVPCNCTTKVTVQQSNPVEFDHVLVSPAQRRLSDDPEQVHEYEYDAAFYSKDVLYPAEVAKVTGPFSVDQYCALLVHVTPLQYNPAKQKIIGYGNVTVTIAVTEAAVAARPDGSDTPTQNDAFGNLLLNPGLHVAERVGLAASPIFVKTTGPTLLVIYAKLFEKAALRLAAWKNQRGLITETVCVDTIAKASDPAFVAKLKKYIRGRRATPSTRLRYVLLFGDADMITPEKGLSSAFGPGTGLSDYYYSTRYDTTTPDPANPTSTLFLPWLAVGRIAVRPDKEGPPASGDSIAQGIVDKIIAYEKTPPISAEYYKRQVFAAAFENDHLNVQPNDHRDDRGYLRTIEEMRTAIAALGYTTERVYVTNDPVLALYDDGTTIPADVKAAMVDPATATKTLIEATSEGQLYIGHRDHGNWDGWINPPFNNTSLDSVTGSVPSMIYSINCQTGRFDYTEPTDCFAEKILRKTGAAPSLIAATRNSNTHLNNDLIRGLYDATFGGVIPTFPGGNASYAVKSNRLGDILNYAKAYLMVADSGDPAAIQDHFQIYHVFGDPSLEVWKEAPLPIAIKATIAKRALEILISHRPADAVVTLWYGGKMLKRIELTSNHISIPLTGLVPVPMPKPIPLRPSVTLCFWATGHLFHEVKVPIPVLTPIKPVVGGVREPAAVGSGR